MYDNLRSFAELENRIGSLGDENSKVVGDALEIFVEGYLATMQAKTVWLVGQVPLAHIILAHHAALTLARTP